MAKILGKINYAEKFDIVKVLCSAKEFADDADETLVLDTFSYRHVLYFSLKESAIKKSSVVSFFLCTDEEHLPSLSVINKLVEVFRFFNLNN